MSEDDTAAEEPQPKPREEKANLKPVFIAIALVLASYPLWQDSGRESTEIPQSINDSSFPSGPAGLVDSRAGTDQLRAMTENYKEKSDTRAKAEPETSHEEIDSEEFDSEEETSKEAGTPQEEKLPAEKSESIEVGPFNLALTGIKNTIRFTSDSKGTFWIAHRFGVVALKDQNPATAKVVLSRGIYDREFNDSLSPVTAIESSPENALWIGFANGQLMRYFRYEWQMLSGPKESIKASISDIIAHKGDVLINSYGMFRWDESFRRAVADSSFHKKRIFTSFVAADGTLFVGGRSGLWQQVITPDASKSWRHLWTPTKKDLGVFAIAETKESSLLLGTNDGIALVSRSGVVEDRLIPGKKVTAIQRNGSQKGYWVATKGSGLRFWNESRWFHVGEAVGLGDWVTSLHLDQKDRLWLGVEGKGVFLSPRADAAKWIASASETEATGFQPQVFADACDAADTIIPGVSVSDDIAVESLDGRGVVFVRGRQQCPKGVGYRRKDGTVVLLNGWNATVYLAKSRQQLVIPEQIPADAAKVVLLDSKNRLWLGTEDRGVFRIDAENRWYAYGAKEGLGNNPVSSMIEDADGRIWLGTVPPLDKERKIYHNANLHLFSDDNWYHFDPRNGLVQISTHALSYTRKKQLLVGTHGGFSIVDPQGNVTNYGPKQGLDPYYVQTISQDRQGRIWLGHQYFGNGLTWFDGKNFHHSDQTNGLFNDRVEVIAHDRAQRIWVIATNGRVGVYPFSFFENNSRRSPLNKKAVRALNLMD